MSLRPSSRSFEQEEFAALIAQALAQKGEEPSIFNTITSRNR